MCKNKYFCEIVMSLEKKWILEFNHYMKQHKTPYIIYADIETLIQKIDRCARKVQDRLSKKAFWIVKTTQKKL